MITKQFVYMSDISRHMPHTENKDDQIEKGALGND